MHLQQAIMELRTSMVRVGIAERSSKASQRRSYATQI